MIGLQERIKFVNRGSTDLGRNECRMTKSWKLLKFWHIWSYQHSRFYWIRTENFNDYFGRRLCMQDWKKNVSYNKYLFQLSLWTCHYFSIYITHYVSPPTQVSITFEKTYGAASLNMWVVIGRPLKFIKLTI
jgi:hypothetical protein